MKCRNALTDVETGRGRFLRDKHGNRPGSCPRGIRHLGGAKPDQALVWNVRTCRLDAKGDVQAAKSARTRGPDAGHRDGVVCSREEGSVMGLDRKRCTPSTLLGSGGVYSAHTRTRKSAGSMTRKLSVTWSQ